MSDYTMRTAEEWTGEETSEEELRHRRAIQADALRAAWTICDEIAARHVGADRGKASVASECYHAIYRLWERLI
jgi:hypothetical protein